jgi:hypothetical protein
MIKHRIRWAAVAVVAAVAVLGPASPGSAVLGGTPDGDGHPYAGVLGRTVDGQVAAGCSGVLISPTVFLTAAHCAINKVNNPSLANWVTFDPDWTLASPPAETYPVAYAAVPAGWDDPLRGHAPALDIGVEVLQRPVTGVTPARLPTAGQLDALLADGALRGSTLDLVGYGASQILLGDGPPQLVWTPVTGVAQRRVAQEQFVSLHDDWLDTNSVNGFDQGSSCGGDSGAPHLLHGSDVVAGINSWLQNACESWTLSIRLDTPDARAFLGQFVTLP